LLVRVPRASQDVERISLATLPTTRTRRCFVPLRILRAYVLCTNVDDMWELKPSQCGAVHGHRPGGRSNPTILICPCFRARAARAWAVGLGLVSTARIRALARRLTHKGGARRLLTSFLALFPWIAWECAQDWDGPRRTSFIEVSHGAGHWSMVGSCRWARILLPLRGVTIAGCLTPVSSNRRRCLWAPDRTWCCQQVSPSLVVTSTY